MENTQGIETPYLNPGASLTADLLIVTKQRNETNRETEKRNNYNFWNKRIDEYTKRVV